MPTLTMRRPESIWHAPLHSGHCGTSPAQRFAWMCARRHSLQQLCAPHATVTGSQHVSRQMQEVNDDAAVASAAAAASGDVGGYVDSRRALLSGGPAS